MNTAKVTSRQSLFDVAVQHCGSMEAAFELALLNDISMSSDLETGMTMTLPIVADNSTVTTFTVNRYMPASGCTQAEILAILDQSEGIEFWGIEYDFIVS